MVEQPQTKLQLEQAPRRLVDARLARTPLSHEVDQQIDALLAAELIAARVEHGEEPLRRVEMLDAPRLRRQHLPLSDVVVDEFPVGRSEEHTSELQSLMRSSYAVFCLKT